MDPTAWHMGMWSMPVDLTYSVMNANSLEFPDRLWNDAASSVWCQQCKHSSLIGLQKQSHVSPSLCAQLPNE